MGQARVLAGLEPYRIRVWKAEDGLPQNSVTSILQTQDGYLWLGTFDGLVRFDGVQFKVLAPDNLPGLPSNRILSLLEDPQGSLWIGTEEGGLARRSNGVIQTSVPPGRGTAGRAARTIVQSRDGLVWILSFEWQLLRLDAGQLSVVSTNWSLHGTHLNGLVTDSLGQLWLGTEKELAVWQDGRFVAVWDQTREKGFAVSGLAPGRAEGCWVVANGRVRRFAEGGWKDDRGAYPPSKAIVAGMCETSHGQVWVATYGNGLFCYQTNGTVMRFSVTNGLPNDFIRCVHEDREGNLWVGTEGSGLARLKPTVFRSYDRHDGLSGDCVLSVCEGEDGEVWIGTNGDGIDRLKNGQIRHYGAEHGLTNEFVWSVYEDRNKKLWAGTWGGGLFCMERDRFVPVDCANPAAEVVVCALFEDSKGAIWVGQQRSRSEVLQLRAGKPAELKLPTQNSYADVRAVTEDRAGNLWIGTYDDGLYRVNDGGVTRFGLRQGLASERIRALYADAEGALWVGTSRGGLNRLQEGQFTAFTAQDGLTDDFILHIAEDRHGYLWCSCGTGVFRVSKEELDHFARGRNRSIRCFAYTKADGLPSLECTGGCQPSGCKTRDGRLWFPTVAGLAVVDPEELSINSVAPPVLIEQVVLEGTAHNSFFPGAGVQAGSSPGALSPARELSLLKVPPGGQRFEIHYTGLSFTAPEKVRFKYKMEGLEEDWVDAGTRREAHYSYLRPGKYNFHVLACNNDGVWNESGASLAMIVLPYFWQTWWFRLLAGALLVLLFVAAYEIRLAAERRLTRLRLRIARDLHDEVGSNLGSIALLGEVLQKQPAGETGEMPEIRRIALQTIDSLRDIVWFLDPGSDNMEELVLRMKETARAMLPAIRFGFNSAGETSAAKPSLELRRNLLPMFKEILHNIVRHSRASQVDISVEFAQRRFQLRVFDNGVGFDESGVRPGNGLKNLRRRAADLEGAIEIESRPGQGTTVTLRAHIT